MRPFISRAVGLWRILPPGQPDTSAIRGDGRSEVLMIAPPPTAFEVAEKLPLSKPAAVQLHLAMLRFGMDTESFLIIPCSRFGKKASKASTESVREYVHRSAKLGLHRLYVCVGSEAFKHIFGGGRKPAQTVFGRELHLRELNHLPLFVLPDIEPLEYVETGNYREDRALASRREKLIAFLGEVLPVLKTKIP